MSTEDKKTLKKAFQDAVARRPDADKINFINAEGKPASPRQIINDLLAKENFYAAYDKTGASINTTAIPDVTDILVQVILDITPPPKSASSKPRM